VPVSRMEIVDTVDSAFETGGADRSEILTAAVATGARPEVIETLERLPDRRFADVRELWQELPELPVEA
jgi:hypothetical protein